LIETFTFFAFYAGIMLLFCLVSIFAYWMFKDSIFLKFAFVEFSFVFYFFVYFYIIDIFYYTNIFYSDFSVLKVAISFVVISNSIFIADYVGFKSNFKRFTPYFYAYFITGSL